MTKKELEKRVVELEKERDLWRDIASKWITAIPQPAPVIWPQPVCPDIYYQIPGITDVTPLATMIGPLSVS